MRPVAAALVVLCLVWAGCGGDEGGADDAVSVVATTTQLGDFARQVAGSRAGVSQILTPNADPHGYEPRPSDARDLEGADVVLRSGGDLDGWLGQLIEGAGSGAARVDLSRSVRTRRGDPHWWQDPRNAIRAVGAIARALGRADPAGRAGYERNARAYVARLRALDRAVAGCIAKLPRNARRLVTTHDALGYYARRYGLEVIGAVIPSLSSQAQPSSKGVGELVDQIRREKVRAIFPESSLSSKLEDAVARESGASVGGKLWADTLGPEGSTGATYVDSIASNTEEIVKGLSGGEVSCRAAPLAAGAAGRALTVQRHVVRGDLEAHAVGEVVNRPFERLVLERLDLAAGVADHVVVVLAARVRGLVARRALADVEALDQPEALEQLQGPVDAGQANAAAALAQQIGDLSRGDRAAQRRDGLDHLLAGGAGAVAGIGEHLEGVVGPLPVGGRQHGPEG